MKNGKPTLGSLKDVGRNTVETYKNLLQKAADSRCAKPIFSGFHVRGAAATYFVVNPALAGNVEYGNCQALHNEEATVAALIARCNSSKFDGYHKVIAIVAGKGKGSLKNLTMPCGNCRDILRDTLGPDCTIIAGAEGGGTAIVTKLSDILFDDFRQISDLNGSGVEVTIRRCEEILHNPYLDPKKFPLRNYGVCIMTGDLGSQKPFFGASVVHADFHPTYPIEVVSLQMWLKRKHRINLVTVVAEGDGSAPPDVMYRDRQRLLEMVIEDWLMTGQEGDPSVYLITHQGQRVTGTWQTSVKEWLPFPFSPHNFGDKFLQHYQKYLKTKYDRK